MFVFEGCEKKPVVMIIVCWFYVEGKTSVEKKKNKKNGFGVPGEMLYSLISQLTVSLCVHNMWQSLYIIKQQ